MDELQEIILYYYVNFGTFDITRTERLLHISDYYARENIEILHLMQFE